jgi:dienelactone hydrolase
MSTTNRSSAEEGFSMKKCLVAGALAVLGVACNPSIPQVAPPNTVVAIFNPAASPPQVPTPNALATNPLTGLLNVPTTGPAYSPADTDFANYLNTLDGYPPDTPANAQFSSALQASTATANSVLVLDVTTGTPTPVQAALAYASNQLAICPGTSCTAPTATWTAGHTYAVVLIGGQNAKGLKGANGEMVVGSQTWFFVRESNSLVTGCTDLTSSSCQPSTNLIPSGAQAAQLEQIRLGYKPILDAVVATGVTRSDIALAWTFKINDLTTVAFNPQPVSGPPVVPSPNDLAIDPATHLVNVPADAGAPAQIEFLTTYLNTLDGFPAETPGTAAVVNGQVDPLSVSTGGASPTVVVADLSAPTGPAIATVGSYDGPSSSITITPPGGWLHGHQYAIAVLVGQGGIQAPKSQPVVASDVWALVRSADTLVTSACTGPTSCPSALSLVPLSSSQAFALEQLRVAYQPIIDGLGLPRQNLALLWTFTIVSNDEATFSPAQNVIPFPNDLVRQGPGGTVSLPIPDGGSPLLQQIIAGLDTLDGFSTTAPIISENSDPVGVLDQGTLDPTTLAAGTGFLPLTAVSQAPKVVPCINCASSLLADGGVQPVQQLQFVPQVPLQEKSTYGAYLTTALKDTNGKPIIATVPFTLLRLTNPLVDANMHATVQGVSDADAQQLELVRQGLKPFLDGLQTAGLPRTNLALAWAFTTQSTVTPLAQLHALPTALGGALPSAPVIAVNITAGFTWPPGIPHSHIGSLFAGEIPEDFLLTGPGGTINPTPPPTVLKVPFTLTEPTGAAPAAGWPVVIFGHGLTRSRNDMLAIADTLAQAGFAVVATDVVWHGDRSSCTGSSIATGQASDDASCANPGTQRCNEATPFGRCVARTGTGMACDPQGTPPSVPPGDIFCAAISQGACIAASAHVGNCEGGDFLRAADGTPVISGWNILNLTNFFATRDNFRQQVPDLAQLARVVADTTSTANLNTLLTAQGAAALDGAKINYTGQSLGGILGTLYTSTAPEVNNAVLNVPGGDLVNILLTSPSFVTQKDEFIGGLQLQGIFPGTPAFDQLLGIAKWVLDPADPTNMGFYLRHGTAPKPKVLIQYIEGDQTVPNPTTVELIGAANQLGGTDPAPTAVCEFTSINCNTSGPTGCMLPALTSRHGFLLNGASTATAHAQADVAAFLVTGASATCP